jgi:PAS domain S-box-containing protein
MQKRVSILERLLWHSLTVTSATVVTMTAVSFYLARPLITIGSEEQRALVLIIARTVVIVGALFVIGAGLVAALLARRLTAPLASLSAKLRALQPGNWAFARSVRTGDEIEYLDEVIADLTARLRQTYEHLEEEVAARTQELREQYARDRTILESIRYGVVAVDTNGRIIDANPAACRMLGREGTELSGTDAVSMLHLTGKSKSFTAESHPLTRCLREREIFRASVASKLSLVPAKGEAISVTIMVTPLLERERLIGALVVFQDVTEERQMDSLKSEFISLASHQLRTPLSSIKWYTELLSQEPGAPLSDVQKSCVEEIGRSGTRMARLIDALLRVVQLEEGGLQAEKHRMNLTAFTHDIVRDWSKVAEESEHSLTSTLPHYPVEITTDPTLLSIVLQNLLSNAVKYSRPKGTIRLAMKEDDGTITITVSDTGVGIPEVDQGHLFEKFFRARNIRHLDTDGSGLGLYITRTILDALGGKVSFESKEGKGSSFTVTLPNE